MTIQNFELPADLSTWPDGAAAGTTTAWAADGRTALRIPGGVLAAFPVSASDWTGADLVRLKVFVPGGRGTALLFEFQDDAPGYHNKHLRSAAAPAGVSVVEIEIGGELWRGEAIRPYRELKTPFNKRRVARMGVTAMDATIFVDAVELVRSRPPAVPGGWAFDFGGERTPVGAGWTGVFPSTTWDPGRGYGFEGVPRALGKTVPLPTVVMGDGLVFGDAEFSVTLPGGPYRGWAVFDRSGFWEGEQAAYARLALAANGATVHEHASTPAGCWFDLEDTEVLTRDDLEAKVLKPVHREAFFEFRAVPGRNRFTVRVDGLAGEAPRLAGLVLEPATGTSSRFLRAYVNDQWTSALRAHQIIAGLPTGAKGTGAGGDPLTCAPLPLDSVLSPADPAPGPSGSGTLVLDGFTGTTRQALLGVWASRPVALTATARIVTAGRRGDLAADAAAVWVNRYLPLREFEMSACRIASHHYHPFEAATAAGPGAPRAVLVRVRIPVGTDAGTYAGRLDLSWTETGGAAGRRSVPLVVTVRPGAFPGLDLPFGVFFSGPPIPREIAGDDRWWRLAESLMDLERDAGLTLTTGGPDYDLRWSGGTATYTGDDAVRYLALAHARGLDLVVTNYGGFSRGLGPHGLEAVPDGMTPAAAARAMARGWDAFAAAHRLPPHLLYAYDEPSTPSEFDGVVDRLKLYKAAGFRTIGYTSLEDPARADANHRALARETFSPAYGEHTPATLGWAHAQGAAPWVYNNGLGRFESGVQLWRMRRAGAAGRVEWIGAIVQGFQYDTLDAREPDPSCFFVHDRLGALFAPRYLALCEGVYDARLLIALERRLPGAPPAVARDIRALFAGLEALPYGKPMLPAGLDDLRRRALGLLTGPG